MQEAAVIQGVFVAMFISRSNSQGLEPCLISAKHSVCLLGPTTEAVELMHSYQGEEGFTKGLLQCTSI